jgi:hypothetical protein
MAKVQATKRKRTKKKNPELTCTHCGKNFVSELVLMRHNCTAKKRYLERNERHVLYAFYIFKRFFYLSFPGRREVTEEKFRKSRHYSSFVKFAKYILDINAVNPAMFIDYVITNLIPINKWCDSSVYEDYLRDLSKRETPDAALERNFVLMQKWANETGEDWTNFFRRIPPTQAVFWIRSGRISPWVLYTAPSAKELFARMSKEQIALVQDVVDPKFWQVKLADNREEVSTITSILQEAGL